MTRRITGLSLAAMWAVALLVTVPDHASGQSCDQTLSVGADVANAVATAADGTTICLNGGDYGVVGFSNISRSGMVALQSVSGVVAEMRPDVWNSDWITFRSMTLLGMRIRQCSTNLQILDSVFVPDASHLLFNDETPCASDQNILVDGNTFDRGRQSGFEGRISIRGQNGVTLSNNTITGISSASPSDGIQVIGNSTNITIGPGNIFDGITQSLCGSVHCDSIQLYGAGPNIAVIGNWFKPGSSTFIMAPDGSSNVTLENNIFDARGTSYQPRVQMGTAANSIQRHNTVIGTNIGCTSKIGAPASTNCVVENNILINAKIDFSFGSGCLNCTRHYNLFQNSDDASGTNNVIGAPVFVGGNLPTTLAGWKLADNSPGKNAGNDGFDMGTNYYGTASVVPSAPTALRLP